jgi:hypothetical protein
MAGYRDEAHCLPGINLAVIDVDEGIDIDTAKLLLIDYKYLMHTTKRHTATEHRFRVIFPLSHILKLSSVDYRTFMDNIYDWLPFKVDAQTNQQSRKWLCNAPHYWYNDGKILDALQFIPKTKKNEERINTLNKYQSLDHVQRWFLNSTNSGNRNNQLIRYSLMLVDSGRNYESIQDAVMDFNAKLPNSLPEDEIQSTIMRTVSKKIAIRDSL